MEVRKHRSLTSTVLFKTLDRFSGRRRPDHGSGGAYQPRRLPTPSAPTHGRRIQSTSYEPPPPLLPRLPPRTRCITPPPFEIGVEEPVILHDQTQSSLFKLPEEVLLMIYGLLIGNRVLHIVRRQEKLGHTSCLSTGEPDACRDAECRGLKRPNGLYVHNEPRSVLIQLLQTCRKVYIDAIKVLYTSNVFDFDSMESIVSLSCSILPQRFDSIQNITLDFRFSLSSYFSESNPSNDSLRWLRTWAIIGSMKSLQNLRARISWHRPTFSAIQEKRLLDSLWMVGSLKTYEISLPPPREGQDVDWSDAPFQVVRRAS